MRFTAAFLVTLLVGTFILTGCGGSKRTVTTADGSVTVTEENKNGSVTIESKDGDSKATASTEKRPITEAELGVPVYPGATGELTSAYEGSEGGRSQTMHQHVLTTPDAFDDVVAFYKSKLRDVKNQSVTTLPEGKIASFLLDSPGGHVTVTINEDRDKNVTQILVIKATGS